MSAVLAAFTCLVVGITDGDTIRVRCGEPGSYQAHNIRISAIDAPERRQPFGNRSREALSALCFKVDATVTPRTTDRWGRTVADVQCRGEDVGSHMVGNGWAWVFDRYARGYAQHLYPVQEQAMQARRGLWQAVDTAEPPVKPWEWRRQPSQREAVAQ